MDAGIITGAAVAIFTMAVQQVIGIIRSRSDHTHELRRDRLGKYYEFQVEEYRERKGACQALLLAVHHMWVMAGTRKRALEMQSKTPSPQSIAAAKAEADEYKSAEELSSTLRDQAARILSVDERAKEVMKIYLALPFGQLLDAPDDKDVRRNWNEGREALQRAIFIYLRALRAELLESDGKDAA